MLPEIADPGRKGKPRGVGGPPFLRDQPLRPPYFPPLVCGAGGVADARGEAVRGLGDWRRASKAMGSFQPAVVSPSSSEDDADNSISGPIP